MTRLRTYQGPPIKRTEKVLSELLEIDKKSERTVKGYSSVFYLYEDFLKGKNPTIENANEFLKSKSKLTKATLSTYRMTLRTYFNKLGIEIPKDALKPLKVNNIREDKFVTRKEVDTLYRCSDKLRDKVAIRILFHAGLRAEELLNLNVGDLELKNEKINVKGVKGSHKIRRVRLIRPELAIPTIRAYLEQRGINPDNPGKHAKEPLILSQKGTRLIYKQLWLLFKRLGETISKPDLSPHWLRHGFVVWNKVHNVQPEICAMQIGDTVETTTKIYSHYSESDIDRVYDDIQGKVSEDSPKNKNPIEELEEQQVVNKELREEMAELKAQQKYMVSIIAKIEAEKLKS